MREEEKEEVCCVLETDKETIITIISRCFKSKIDRVWLFVGVNQATKKK